MVLNAMQKFRPGLSKLLRRSPFRSANPLVQRNGSYIHDQAAFLKRLHDIYIPHAQTVTTCPCCANTDFSALHYPQNYRPQEQIFLSDERLSQKLWMCTRCGLILSRNLMPPDFYFEYINSSYDNFHAPSTDHKAGAEVFYRKKHQFIKDLAGPYLSQLPEKPRVLEVSSFVGTGLSDMADTWDVFGLEAENEAAIFSVQHYPELQGRIVNDVLENATLPGGSLTTLGALDAVFFMYSFRQIAYPTQVIRWLKNALKPGGIVVFAEGVFSDFIFDEGANAAKHFFHNKTCYYNTLNLSALMASHGFVFLEKKFLGAIPSERDFDQSAILFRNDNQAPASPDFQAALTLSKEIFSYFLSKAS